MNTYDYLISNPTIVSTLIKNGIMPMKYSSYLEIYRQYLDLMELHYEKSFCVKWLSANHNLSMVTIYGVINEMEQDVKTLKKC